MIDVSMSPESFLETLRGPVTPGNAFAKPIAHYDANLWDIDQYWKLMGSNFHENAFSTATSINGNQTFSTRFHIQISITHIYFLW
jgi:hypothetical protein